MERIVQIKGNTAYPITLDPTVWIFDERKKKLADFFNGESEEQDELEMYTKAISKQWDKEVIEGKPYKLIEAVAETVASRILSQYEGQVMGCRVEIIKPDPPIPGHYKEVAVEIVRGAFQ